MQALLALGANSNTPLGSFQLSAVDQVSPRIYLERLLCFERTGPLALLPVEYTFLLFTVTLRETLLDFPCLASTVDFADWTRASLLVRLDVASRAVFKTKDYTHPTLEERWVSGSYQELRQRGFPISALSRSQLLPTIPPLTNIIVKPVSYFQVNIIPGGVILGFGVHRSVCEEHAIGCFLRLWSLRLEKRLLEGFGDEFETHIPQQMVDRTTLRGQIPTIIPRTRSPDDGNHFGADHIRHSTNRPDASHPTNKLPVVWRIDHPSLICLRDRYCNRVSQIRGIDEDDISDNSILTSFLWLCINQARRLPDFGLGQSSLAMFTSLRERDDRPLGIFYMGNAWAVLPVDLKWADPSIFASFWDSFVLAANSIHSVRQWYTHQQLNKFLDSVEALPAYGPDTILPVVLDKPNLMIHSESALNISVRSWGNGLGRPVIRVVNDFDQGDCVFLSTVKQREYEILTNLTPVETLRLAHDHNFRRFFSCASGDFEVKKYTRHAST